MNEPNNFQIKEPNNIEVKEPGNIEIIDMNGVIPIPKDLLNDENLVGNAISMDTGISPSPLDNMDAGELEVLLNMPVDEALKMEARAKLDSMTREEVDTLGHGNSQVQAKTYTNALPQFKSKGREDDAGYINIIILMLTVWATCLCGMFYVYSQLSITG